jgi:hypothetical protein
MNQSVVMFEKKNLLVFFTHKKHKTDCVAERQMKSYAEGLPTA